MTLSGAIIELLYVPVQLLLDVGDAIADIMLSILWRRMRTRTAIAFALTWRIAIACSTRTFFQPDEFYQSLEVAHHAVFGYGHLTWEWSSKPPIRSPAFPALFVPVYWTLKATGLDDSALLILAPKVLQGIFAAITDISTRELAKRLLGPTYKEAAFFLSLTSLFNILALSRTLSNSLETSLVVAAMCFSPIQGASPKSFKIWLLLIALGCLLRPTAAIVWTVPALKIISRWTGEATLISHSLAVIVPALLLNVFIDSSYYGQFTFTPLNFVVTNLSSVSQFYGRAPWHYYLSQGLPILLNVSLPAFVTGTIQVYRRSSLDVGTSNLRELVQIIGCTTLIYSLLGHKEWRFLHPLLPLMIVVASKPMVDGFAVSKNPSSRRVQRFPCRTITMYAALASLLPGLYVMRLHGRAQIEVMHYLRSAPEAELRSVGFLTPCHSTPWQSYLHRPHLTEGLLWSIGCEPPLNVTDTSSYRDQSDVFYESPLRYLAKHFPNKVDSTFPPSPFPSTKPGELPPVDERWDHNWPSHFVFFGALVEGNEGSHVANYLTDRGYAQVWNATNGFEEDPRRRGGMAVWAWRP